MRITPLAFLVLATAMLVLQGGAAADDRVVAGHDEARPPHKLGGASVILPPDVLATDQTERIVVRAVVDTDGRLREPTVLVGRSESAALVAMEALRGWRFEPAQADGQPVAAIYELTVPLAPDVPADDVEAWRQRLRAVEGRLRAGDWGGALPEAQALVADIADRVGRGGSDLVAQAGVLLALAEAGLERYSAAAWHWQAACALALQTRYQDLEPYGAAGAFLARQELRSPAEGSTGAAVDPGAGPQARRPLEAPPPRLPSRQFLELGIFELVVDDSGRPGSPLILEGAAPGALWAALEALSQWRFEAPQAAPALQEIVLPLAELQPLDKIVPPVQETSTPRDPTTTEQKAARETARDRFGEALRYAALGDERQALAIWRRAQHLAPQLALVDLSDYGPAGELLAGHRYQAPGHWSLRDSLSQADTGESPRRGTGPFHIGGEVERPVKIYTPAPQYTKKARKARVQGVVIVQAIIDKQGLVRDIKVLKGLREGLSEEAVKAISRWRFLPATLEGEPVDVYYNLTVNFRLERRRRPPL